MFEQQNSLPDQIHSLHKRHRFLQQHPVLTPLLFLTASTFLSVACFFEDNAFPLLSAFGVPSIPLCLSLALILGTCGVLISIISFIERFDRRSFKVALFLKSKEHSYVSN